jgi:hypothetical protein
MKRFVAVLMIGYTGLALWTRAREAIGRLSCRCDPDCWCRKPGLGLFRWVFPYLHEGEPSSEVI